MITPALRRDWHDAYFGHIEWSHWELVQGDILSWCIDNLDNKTWIYPGGGREFFFKSKEDATSFKLMWWDA